MTNGELEMVGLKRGTVKLSNYSPEWPRLFETEKNLIAKALDNLVVDIQHVGSTSIRGMIAKPIIDIDVGVRNLKDMQSCRILLGLMEYDWTKKTSKNHIVAVKGPEANRTHHVHLIKHGGKIWKNDLLFRNFLSSHDEWVKKYAELKKLLAREYPGDRLTYTKKKEFFIKQVLKIAKK